MKNRIQFSLWAILLASFSMLLFACNNDEIGMTKMDELTREAASEMYLFQVDQPELLALGKKASVDNLIMVQELVDSKKISGELETVSSAELHINSEEFKYLFVRGYNSLGESMFVAFPIKLKKDGTVKLIVGAVAPSCTGQNGCQHCEEVLTGTEITGCDCQNADPAWCKFKACKTKHGQTLCCTSMRSCEKCDFVEKNDSLQSCACKDGPTGGWCQPKMTFGAVSADIFYTGEN